MKKIPFDYSTWIWCAKHPSADEYGEFYDSFHYTGEQAVTAYISADSNYAVYVNGKLAASGQYADYPYDKVYDELDLTDYCKRGLNHLAIVVWYYGLPSLSTYYLGRAALRYAVWEDERLLAASSAKTRSRLSHAYRQHEKKIITSQLGLTFSYNAAAEDEWMLGKADDLTESVMAPVAPHLRPRPCKRPERMEPCYAAEIKRLDDGAILLDLGREEVGFLTLSLHSQDEQAITVAYGEHIVDGRVRRTISKRDFSVEYRTKQGKNAYVNPFRRLAARYLEIRAEDPTKLSEIQIGIVPVMYPLNQLTPPPMNEEQKRIYDACIRTLRLCMHEHYEDCPWREQALYTMDSRNQMLCGYHAFGEYLFARANLDLIARDEREDGLLAICYPSSFDLAIPSFSLHFITEVYEFLKYSANKWFVRGIYPKMRRVMKTFEEHMENGLVKQFAGHWNFYEWSPGLSGSLSRRDETDPHLVLNCLYLSALRRMSEIAGILADREAQAEYTAQADRLAESIREAFYDAARGVFVNEIGKPGYSCLGNSLAILCELVTGEEADCLAERMLCDKDMTPLSLSMQCFLYDALLKVSDAYASFVLADIKRVFVPMLDGGTGTVWETEKGESDFANAGSLCHGWSAMPVYYYHLLLK